MSALVVQYVTCDAPGCGATSTEGYIKRADARREAEKEGWRFRVWPTRSGIAPVGDFCAEHAHLADAVDPPNDHRKRTPHPISRGVGRGKTWHDAVKARLTPRTLDAEGRETIECQPGHHGSDG